MAKVGFKKGVRASGAVHITAALSRLDRKTATITSVDDGRHKTGSKHGHGDAADIRIRDQHDAPKMVDELREELGRDFDVILEKDHIHAEYDPKT